LSATVASSSSSRDLFDQAGITENPTTLDELEEATVALKGAGIDPIALGAKDAWPAAHWYYWLALRECSSDTLAKAADEMDFSDECWVRAGEDLQSFAETEPFTSGFLTTPAQQGAGSSAGLIANHQAAMELMGAWNPGVIGSLTPDQKPLADLSWFPFPEVEGGDGEPGSMMGGVDGYSCSVDAPDACVDFLNYIGTSDVQTAYYRPSTHRRSTPSLRRPSPSPTCRRSSRPTTRLRMRRSGSTRSTARTWAMR